jgi:hypothetical protein
MSKQNIEKLISKFLKTNENDFDKKKIFEEFIMPLFEFLGWDFQTDVIKPESVSENKAGYAFQIEEVTRFYLSVIPPSKSINDLKEIHALTTFAFNKGVTWAILTNFKELRVYNVESPGTTPGSMQHYSFTSSEYITKFEDLQDLTKHQFSLNVLDSDAELFGKKPKRISVDKQLLKDLLNYRDNLMKDIIKNNSINEEKLQQAVQKILNRLIFIRSCGDRKIEERFLISSLNEWNENKNKKLNEYLHETFKYFCRTYGSSLFEKHSCDDLKISDSVLEEIISGLYKSKKRSVSYDFSLISSDILGKMYENYLGTIQRKKDGAYYTPNYISNHICENAIIPYLSKSNVNNIPKLISEYANNIEELESKIRNIKILDPACGTGEFLIRAIEVLQKISKVIQSQKQSKGHYSHTIKKKKSGTATFETFDKNVEEQELHRIIQNNIFGVDINKEAIEITQLNLFLKIATTSQKLLDVSRNLKVGNSLVNDKEVDQNAFNWKIFSEKFDIIIGNPPYVRQELIGSMKSHLEKRFTIYNGVADLYVYFFELGLNLLDQNGVLNFIISNKWMKSNYGENLRALLEGYYIDEIIDFGDTQIFEGATTYPCIIKITKKKQKNSKIKSVIINNSNFKPLENFIELNQFYFDQNELNSEFWNVVPPQIRNLFGKINTKCITLGDYVGDHIHFGVKTGLEEVFIIDENTKERLIKEDQNSAEIIKPYLSGADVGRYHVKSRKRFVIFTRRGINIEHFPAIKNHLLPFKKRLTPKKNRSDTIGRKPGSYQWYELQDNIAYFREFSKQKIIYGKIAVGPRFCYDTKGYMVASSNFILPISDMKLLGILNSKLGWFFVKNTCTHLHGGYSLLWTHLKNIPIKKNDSKNLESLVVKILRLNKELDSEQLNKKRKEIENEIENIDRLIDDQVYELYDITEDEKVIIESYV